MNQKEVIARLEKQLKEEHDKNIELRTRCQLAEGDTQKAQKALKERLSEIKHLRELHDSHHFIVRVMRETLYTYNDSDGTPLTFQEKMINGLLDGFANINMRHENAQVDMGEISRRLM